MSRTTTLPNSFAIPSAADFDAAANKVTKQINSTRSSVTLAQKIGIGIGVTLAILGLLSVIGFGIMLIRGKRRRRRQMRENEKMYQQHQVDPSPEMDVAVYGGGNGNGANGYELAGKSEFGGVEAGRAEMGNTSSGVIADGQRKELGGREVRVELGAGEGIADGNKKVAEKKMEPVELQ